ncbi:hypothetical protein FS749_009920 [Ceratobasidium sp. UAMH 11750]|nr:hypothetical protein FS749_009920 [Ceratobasidium sp. UAMH 11750]
MPYNATTPEEVAMSFRPAETLTVVYQEGPNGEKRYASVVASPKYKDILDSACECFEEYLPPNWKSCTVDLQHEIKARQWAVIHPGVFSKMATDAFRLGEIRLRIRQAEPQNTINRGQIDDVLGPSRPDRHNPNSIPPTPPPYTRTQAQSSSPPPVLILERAELPITDLRNDAFCDRCKHNISGVRYRCNTCNDFDYCAVCIGFAPIEHAHRFEVIINGCTRIFRPMDAHHATGLEPQSAVRSPPQVQHDARCDICGTVPILGTRFKCAVCPDWDACEKCLERSTSLHPKHMFIRVVDHSVLMPRDIYAEDPKYTKMSCDACNNDIFGPVFYQCKAFWCPIKYLCADCEALPLSRPCKHPLVKRRV